MVHFPGFARTRLWIQRAVQGFYPCGFPHSEIPGSKPACGSPRLIAACHVLLRHLPPRHPPCALSSLTTKFTQHSPPWRVTPVNSWRHRLIAPGYCEPETPADLGTHKIYSPCRFFRVTELLLQLLPNLVSCQTSSPRSSRPRPAWAGFLAGSPRRFCVLGVPLSIAAQNSAPQIPGRSISSSRR
jgi:hypothetical protein